MGAIEGLAVLPIRLGSWGCAASCVVGALMDVLVCSWVGESCVGALMCRRVAATVAAWVLSLMMVACGVCWVVCGLSCVVSPACAVGAMVE